VVEGVWRDLRDSDFHHVVRLVDGHGGHAGDESVAGIGVVIDSGGEVAFGGGASSGEFGEPIGCSLATGLGWAAGRPNGRF